MDEVMLNFDYNDVVNQLTTRIGQLEADKAVLNAIIKQTRKELEDERNKHTDKSGPSEAQ